MKNSAISLPGNTRANSSSSKVYENTPGNKIVPQKVISLDPIYSTNTIRNNPLNNINSSSIKTSCNIIRDGAVGNGPITNNITIVNNIKTESPVVYNKPPLGTRSVSQLTNKRPNRNVALNNRNNNDSQLLNESIYSNTNSAINNNNCNSHNNSHIYYSNVVNNGNNGYKYMKNQKDSLGTDIILQTKDFETAIVNDNADLDTLLMYNKNNPSIIPDENRSNISGHSSLMYYNNKTNKFSNNNLNESGLTSKADKLNKSSLNESVLNKSDLGKSNTKKVLRTNFESKNEVELMPEFVETVEKDNKHRGTRSPGLVLSRAVAYTLNNMMTNSNSNNSYLKTVNYEKVSPSHSNQVLGSVVSQQNLKPNVYVKNSVKAHKNTHSSTITTLSSEKIKNHDKFSDTIQSGVSEITNSTILTGTSVNTIKNTYQKNQNKSVSACKVTSTAVNSKLDNCYVNIEDLILIEEKLTSIINNLRKNEKSITNYCYDWYNFMIYTEINLKLECYFKEISAKNIIKESSVLELIVVILTYDISYDTKFYQILEESLYSALIYSQQNFLIVCDYILSKVTQESRSNIWVQKLSMLLNKKLKNMKKEYTTLIKQNNEQVKKILKLIIRVYNYGELIKSLSPLITNINFPKLTVMKINDIFKTKSFRVENKNGSVPASFVGAENLPTKIIKGPYVSSLPVKPYTLVLDLDETLIHFAISNAEENKGILSLRPGIYEFLDKVSKYYELMVFTAATEDYADPMIDAIERNTIYFDYRFYRQHTFIKNGEFIKDIAKIGRDLSKTIIVDNMPQNFRLQKENGIFIKTFYGHDTEDTALYDLANILIIIAESKSKDVRVSLLKYKDEILRKITSNISKQH